MKIRFPQSITVGDSVTVDAPALSFYEDSGRPNTWTARASVILPNSGGVGDTRKPTVDIPIRVVTDTSASSKGVRRVMVKVAMPYQSMRAKDELLTTPIEPDPSRTGGDLSVHTVLTLPAAAAKDRVGANGGVAKRGCLAQSRLVALILGAIVEQLGMLTMNENAEDAMIILSGDQLDAGDLASTIAADDPVAIATTMPVIHPKVTKTSCGVEVDLQKNAAGECLDSAIERGLAGLQPITADSVFVVDTKVTAEAAD